MKGKRVKAMGGKNVGMGKRVTAKKGKRVKAMKGKRVKARGGNKIQKLAEGGKATSNDDVKSGAEMSEMFKIKPDETATQFLKRIERLRKKFPKAYEKANKGAGKRLNKSRPPMYQNLPDGPRVGDDVKAAAGGKIKKVGTRVKARGGNKIKKLAKGTSSGGIGAAASSAAEKASKDKGTKRSATSIASVNKMDKNKLKLLVLEMLRQKNN